jgi:5'-phosphate synthase pdxT subunit
MRRVGILALQGAVSEHMDMAARCGAVGVPVRAEGDLSGLDALVIPGGESTVIGRLIERNHLAKSLRGFARGRPVLGTCAGLILCAGEVLNPGAALRPLQLMDIVVERNSFGRQADSFETKLEIYGLGDFPAVFIRAPVIRAAGPGVRVLATFGGSIVMAEQGHVLAASFHPELTEDTRVYRYFLSKTDSGKKRRIDDS